MNHLSKDFQQFFFSAFVRFLEISLLVATVYLIFGGKLHIFIEAWPKGLMMSLIGFGFLATGDRWPRASGSLEELVIFRNLAYKVYWIINVIIVATSTIIVMGHLTDSAEEIGEHIAHGLVTLVENALFFMSLILARHGGSTSSCSADGGVMLKESAKEKIVRFATEGTF